MIELLFVVTVAICKIDEMVIRIRYKKKLICFRALQSNGCRAEAAHLEQEIFFVEYLCAAQ